METSEQVSFEDVNLDEYEVDKDYVGSEHQKAVHASHFDGFYTNLNTEKQRFNKFIAVARHNVSGNSLSALPNEQFLGRNLLFLAWQEEKEELRGLHSRIQGNIDALALYEGEPIVVTGVDYLAVDTDSSTDQSSFFYGQCLGENSVEIKTIKVAKEGPLSDLRCVYGGLSAAIRGNYYIGSDVMGFHKVGRNGRNRNVRLNSIAATAHASLVDQAEPLNDPLHYHLPLKPVFHHSEVLYGEDAENFMSTIGSA